MKKNNRFIFYLLIVLSFAYVGNVSASPDAGGGGTYHSKVIQCYYHGIRTANQSNMQTGGQTTITKKYHYIYGVQAECHNDKCTEAYAWGHGAYKEGCDVVLTNYDSIFTHDFKDKYADIFQYKSGFGFNACPDYINLNNQSGLADISGVCKGPGIEMEDFSNSSAELTLYKTHKLSEIPKTDDSTYLKHRVQEYLKDFNDTIGEGTNDGKTPNQEIKVEDGNKSLAERIISWWDSHKDSQKDDSEYDNADCTGLLSGFKDDLKSIISIINIAGAVILVITMSVDFVKAIASGEADNMAKTFKNSRNRIIATIILLLLPVIINFAIEIINGNIIQTKNGEIKIGKTTDCIK